VIFKSIVFNLYFSADTRVYFKYYHGTSGMVRAKSSVITIRNLHVGHVATADAEGTNPELVRFTITSKLSDQTQNSVV
jgi:hypothetical protein